jgi:hypothetical protein
VKRYRDQGIGRVVTTLPSASAAGILSLLKRWGDQAVGRVDQPDRPLVVKRTDPYGQPSGRRSRSRKLGSRLNARSIA